jgi:TRAP-type C4-dicarboxylate transport system permease small subunit
MRQGFWKRFDVAEERVESVILIGLIAAMFLLVVLQILARVVAQSPTWTEEVSRYLMVWLAFFGAAVCLRHDEHVGFTLLPDCLSGFSALALRFVARLVTLALMSVILLEGVLWVTSVFHSGQKTITFQFPVFWIALAIPVAGLLGAAHALRLLIKGMNSKRKIQEIE